MLLKNLIINNFMPYYGENTIVFPTDRQSNVVLFFGENTKGKTSILNALRWVLYGEIEQRGKILTYSDFLNKKAKGEGDETVFIELNFEAGEDSYMLRRTQGDEDVTAAILTMEKNGKPMDRAAAGRAIERIAPSGTKRFFLFDGELLSEYQELMEPNSSTAKKIKRAVKAVDDIMKVSKELTMERLQEAGLTMEKATALLELFQKVNSLPPPAAIEYLKGLNIGNKQFKTGIRELEQVVNGILDNGVCIDNLLIDPRIARGLNYYTGTVCETTLLDMPELGSVCSGGRYNGLMGKLTNNTDDPSQCFGMSIGFTRLIPALINAGAIPAT